MSNPRNTPANSADWDPLSPAPSNSVSSGKRGAESQRILQISRTLAAHGAGVAASELAFDLVLHEIAQQACETIHASAAYIAWIRDGEMVCRATTGENSPELGTRVDVRAGLAAECVNRGTIQSCRDSGSDSRADAEAFRSLGIRSVVLIPIAVRGEVVGILYLLAAQSDAFSSNAIRSVQPYILQILQARREVEEAGDVGLEAGMGNSGKDSSPDTTFKPEVLVEDHNSYRTSLNQYTNLLLLALALGAALVLGLVLGWGRGKGLVRDSFRSSPQSLRTAIIEAEPSVPQSDATATATRKKEEETSASEDRTAQPDIPASRDASPGGLVISENGKIIYRLPASQDAKTRSANSSPRQLSLLRKRVDPAYPADAIAHRVQGPVVLRVAVLEDGEVGEVTVVSGDLLLVGAAVEAVKQWRFQPRSAQEKVRERETRVTVNFSLPPQQP